jgi:hypothetical protein
MGTMMDAQTGQARDRRLGAEVVDPEDSRKTRPIQVSRGA